MSSWVSSLKGIGYSIAGAVCALVPMAAMAVVPPPREFALEDIQPPVAVDSLFVVVKPYVTDLLIAGIGFMIAIVIVGFLVALALGFFRKR